MPSNSKKRKEFPQAKMIKKKTYLCDRSSVISENQRLGLSHIKLCNRLQKIKEANILGKEKGGNRVRDWRENWRDFVELLIKKKIQRGWVLGVKEVLIFFFLFPK